MTDGQAKICDSCGSEIPNSANRSMSEVDTYWCDQCEWDSMSEDGGETMEELQQRLADREALGVESRPANPMFEWRSDGRDA